MPTQVPGSLITNASQTADIAALYQSVQTLREFASANASPILQPAGLLQVETTSEEEYVVPVPPLSLGRLVRFKDGDRPGATKSQGYRLKGTCQKRGIEPLRFMEGDRRMNRVNWVVSNTMARGRAERLMADREGSAAIEAGETTAQLSFDEVTYFNTQHLQNAQDPASTKFSNRLSLALSPSSLYEAKTTMRKWKAENGDPIYVGGELEFILMAPPALEETARKAVERETVEEGGAALQNVSKGIARVFINPFLTDDTAWYLWAIGLGVAPVMRIVYRDMERNDLDNTSELYKKTKEIEIFSDEWTDYRLTDWRVGLKSKP